MSVEELDDSTTRWLDALLDSADDVVPYDNRRNPVALRDTGTSYVQTIPDGARNVLDLDDGTLPDIYIHQQSNAITFVYD